MRLKALLAVVLLIAIIHCSGNKTGFRLTDEILKQSEVPVPAILFNPEHYIIYRTSIPPVIDGKIDEKDWKNVLWSGYFTDIEGSLKPDPLYKTRVKMLWDDDYLYIAAHLDEPHVWANLKKRDSVIFYDNDFEIFIDPDGDTHRYFEIEINAFNTVWDLLLIQPYRDEGGDIWSWDIQGLKSSVYVNGTINNSSDTDEFWSVEMAIPWNVLKECAFERRAPKPGEQWRINFSRVEWQTDIISGKYVKKKNPDTGKNLPEYNWVWSPQGVINMHYPERWGYVQFSSAAAGKGSDVFEKDEFSNVKLVLRDIYYRQRAFRESFGVYTADPAELNLPDYALKGYIFPPEITVTDNLYEAVIKSNEKNNWRIRQDGLIWMDK